MLKLYKCTYIVESKSQFFKSIDYVWSAEFPEYNQVGVYWLHLFADKILDVDVQEIVPHEGMIINSKIVDLAVEE